MQAARTRDKFVEVYRFNWKVGFSVGSLPSPGRTGKAESLPHRPMVDPARPGACDAATPKLFKGGGASINSRCVSSTPPQTHYEFKFISWKPRNAVSRAIPSLNVRDNQEITSLGRHWGWSSGRTGRYLVLYLVSRQPCPARNQDPLGHTVAQLCR